MQTIFLTNKQKQMGEQNKDSKRTVCEIWSRVNGYLRPVSQYNDAKVSEWKERKFFDLDNSKCKREAPCECDK